MFFSGLANPDYIPIILDLEVYKPTTLQETHIIYKWEELRREYTNKTRCIYYIILAELLSTRKSKRYDILIRAKSSTLI